MEALIYRKSFRNTVVLVDISIIPALLLLDKRDAVGSITVNFVRRHVDEDCLGGLPPARFQEIERSNRIGVEVFERNSRGAVMRRLSCSMNDQIRFDFAHQRLHAGTIAD